MLHSSLCSLVHSMLCSFKQRNWAALAVLLCCGVAHAHEIGTTRVSVLLQERRTYEVEIVTDASALADKLAVSTGGSVPAKLDPAGFQVLFESFEPTFRQR